MPIDARTYEQGETEGSIEKRIIDLLCDNPNTAYNVREIAVEVMGEGVSETNVDRTDEIPDYMAEYLDVATVSAILDRLVDDGEIDRRLVDAGKGKRSYYRAPDVVRGNSG